MRLPILSGVCLSLATITLSAKDAEFSHNRDLPPLKLAATDLDTILLKMRSLVAAANGPLHGGEVIRESVKLGVRGKEIEIPHFSLASSGAFPKQVFRFSYTYYQPDKAISSVTLDFSDYSRRVSVKGRSADQVETISNLLENDLRRYSTTIGGAMFRHLAGVCLCAIFLLSLMISSGLLVEHSTLQRIGDADLLGSWPSVGTSRAVAQVSSRLCSLSELFAFSSR